GAYLDGGIGKPTSCRSWLFRVIHVLNAGAKHPRRVLPIWDLFRERIQAVLAFERITHAHIRGHNPHADDAKVHGIALAHEFIDVQRLVRTVESADTEVQNTGAYLRAVIFLPDNWQVRQGLLVQLDGGGHEKMGSFLRNFGQ